MKFIDSWQQQLKLHRAIAVIRSPRLEVGLAMAHAAAAGGIKLIEITWNSDRPVELIEQLQSQLLDCTIGVGTILNLQQLKQAIATGAQFVFCPHFDQQLLDLALHTYQIPLVPGVLSPTEIVQAWRAGATTVKVFPIQAVGGAQYLESLQGPLRQIALIPTGGVTIHNAPEMISAGAIAVALSGSLFPATLVNSHNWQEIRCRAEKLLTSLS